MKIISNAQNGGGTGDWTALTPVTGTTAVPIPASAKEVYVTASKTCIYSVFIITDAPTGAYREGYYTTPSSYGYCAIRWDKSNREISLSYMSFTTTDETNSATVSVWYR